MELVFHTPGPWARPPHISMSLLYLDGWSIRPISSFAFGAQPCESHINKICGGMNIHKSS